MTNDGYTGWDNWVKEQQCKIELDMIPLTDYTTWRYQTDSTLTLNQKEMDMDKRVKDLEERCNIHGGYYEKIRALEEWKKEVDYTQGLLLERRLYELEEWKGRYIKELGHNPDARLEDVKSEKFYEYKWIPIDKQVWEDIKGLISDLNRGIIRNKGTRRGDEIF